MSTGYMAQPPELPATDLRRAGKLSLFVGLAFTAISVMGAFWSPTDFYRSYLMSYLFWIGLTLGSMALVMVHHLTGGQWGVVIRRSLEAASRTLPLLVVLFVPIAAGIPQLYGWAHPEIVKHDEVLEHRSSYMNPGMFLARAVIYFAIWWTLIFLLTRWSARQGETAGIRKRLSKISAPGLILYVFTISFAAIDWAESLEPHWASTMWGFLFVAGQGLTAVAFSIVVLSLLSRRPPLQELVTPSHFQDLGKLLLMFVMLWAYFSFAQLLIVWSGNLTDEIPWFIWRIHTSWGWLGVALIVFQFIVPFLLLLSRPLKRNPRLLTAVVGILVVMRFVDLAWIVMPSFYRNGIHISWLAFSLPVAVGGLWVAFFLWELGKQPLLPAHAGTELLEEAEHEKE